MKLEAVMSIIVYLGIGVGLAAWQTGAHVDPTNLLVYWWVLAWPLALVVTFFSWLISVALWIIGIVIAICLVIYLVSAAKKWQAARKHKRSLREHATDRTGEVEVVSRRWS